MTCGNTIMKTDVKWLKKKNSKPKVKMAPTVWLREHGQERISELVDPRCLDTRSSGITTALTICTSEVEMMANNSTTRCFDFQGSITQQSFW